MQKPRGATTHLWVTFFDTLKQPSPVADTARGDGGRNTNNTIDYTA